MKPILFSLLLLPLVLTGCVSVGAGVGPGGVGAGVDVGMNCPNPAPQQYGGQTKGVAAHASNGATASGYVHTADSNQQVAQE